MLQPSLKPFCYLATALWLGGCLSLEQVSQRGAGDGGAEPNDEGDAGTRSDAGNAARCFERGSYDIDAVTVQGLRFTCDGDLACIEERCVPLPDCAEGVAGSCRFTPRDYNGPVKTFALMGGYVYWVELGTLDALHRYGFDGALARAKIGTWTREQVVGGLDFFDEAGGALESIELLTTDELVVVNNRAGDQSIVVEPEADGSKSYRSLDCVAPDGTGFYRAGSALHSLDLVMGTDAILTTLEPARCDLAGKTHVWWTTTATAKRYRVARAGGEVVEVPRNPNLLLREDGEHVFAARNWSSASELMWIAAAPIAGNPPVWSNVAGGTSADVGTPPLITNNHALWLRADTERQYAVVLRTFIAEPGRTTEVLAELPEIVAATQNGDTSGELLASDRHFAWHLKGAGTLRYFPLF